MVMRLYLHRSAALRIGAGSPSGSVRGAHSSTRPTTSTAWHVSRLVQPRHQPRAQLARNSSRRHRCIRPMILRSRTVRSVFGRWCLVSRPPAQAALTSSIRGASARRSESTTDARCAGEPLPCTESLVRFVGPMSVQIRMQSSHDGSMQSGTRAMMGCTYCFHTTAARAGGAGATAAHAGGAEATVRRTAIGGRWVQHWT